MLNADEGNVDMAVRQDERRYRTLLASTVEIIWTADDRGTLTSHTSTNPLFTSLTSDEHPGTGWLAAIHPDDRDRVERDWRAAVQDVTPYTSHHRVRASDGAYRHMYVRGVPLINDGRVTEWVGTSTDIDERVRATQRHDELLAREQAARAEAERIKQQLHETLERVTDAFISLDTNWHYVYVNHKAAQVFGRLPEDMIGQHIWTEFPEGVGQKFHLAYERAMAEQIPIEIEEYYPPYNRWFENRIVPSPSGLSIYFQDITERKLDEIEEQHRTARHDVLSEFSCALAAMGLDYEAVLHQVVQRTAELIGDGCSIGLLADDGQTFMPMIGHHTDPALWDSARALFGNDSVPLGDGSFKQTIQTGEALLVPHANPTSMPCGLPSPYAQFFERDTIHSIIAMPLRLRGTVIGVLRLVRDQTPAAFTDADLHFAQELADRATLAIENARLYKQAQEQAAHADILATFSQSLARLALDYEGVLNHITRHVAELIGDSSFVTLLSDNQQHARRIASYHVDPEYLATYKHVTRSVSITSGTNDVIRRVYEGEPVLIPRVDWAQLSTGLPEDVRAVVERTAIHSIIGVPLMVQGRVIGSMRLSRDKTPDPYTEDDLRFAQELADRAALAIENARLYQQAQIAITQLEQFMSVAAHELKTPLTSLLGFTFLLEQRNARDSTLQPFDRQAIKLINDQSQRLDRLINALLDVVRLQNDSFNVELHPTDICAVVQQVVGELQPTLDRHNLLLQIPDAPLQIEGDALRLEQVVRNLLQNAIKYSPRGGPIEIRVWQEEAEVRLAVSDRGIGIPAEAQTRLFEQFYRARNIDPRQISGLGIGLYVVHEIVQRHNGTIDVDSIEGRGSTFTVRLRQCSEPQDYH